MKNSQPAQSRLEAPHTLREVCSSLCHGHQTCLLNVPVPAPTSSTAAELASGESRSRPASRISSDNQRASVCEQSPSSFAMLLLCALTSVVLPPPSQPGRWRCLATATRIRSGRWVAAPLDALGLETHLAP
eukprot:4285699-Pleurochrysis_carterae.AAC.1